MADTGINCKAYYNSGSYGSPTWVELSCIDELQENSKTMTADANSRASFIRLKVGVDGDLSWTGTIKRDGSAAHLVVYRAMKAKTSLDMLILDGPVTTNGVMGHRADCLIIDTSNNQNRTERLYDSIEIVPTESNNIPKHVLITGGVVTMATMGTGSALSYA